MDLLLLWTMEENLYVVLLLLTYINCAYLFLSLLYFFRFLTGATSSVLMLLFHVLYFVAGEKVRCVRSAGTEGAVNPPCQVGDDAVSHQPLKEFGLPVDIV